MEIKYGLCRLRFSGIDLFLLNAFFPAVRNVGLKLSLGLTHPFILVSFCFVVLFLSFNLTHFEGSTIFQDCLSVLFFFLPYIYKVGFE